MCRTPITVGMENLISPIIAGAGLAFGLTFLMAVANGMSTLIFSRSVSDAVDSRLGSA